tara:strand:+ start:452 stop:592 length:141 start_codon:yes stop_codon:yes gene_type:complete
MFCFASKILENGFKKRHLEKLLSSDCRNVYLGPFGTFGVNPVTSRD